jgi:hypothetical protein
MTGWDDFSTPALRDLARDNGVKNVHDLTRPDLISALEEKKVEPLASNILSGPQDAPHFPKIPITEADFRQLLPNPDLPPERQSAPSQEQLNPHLFPNRLP